PRMFILSLHDALPISEMVKLIAQIGPDLAEVSRRLGIFKETVRYRYKGLIEKGFAVQVAPNYERMGLQRMISTIDFSLEFRQYADRKSTRLNSSHLVI